MRPRLHWQDVSDVLETMSKIPEGDAVSTQPVLITGPAACGKSNLAKRHARRLATAFLARKGELVPLLVTVVELAATISERRLGPADDLIGEHIRRAHRMNTALADFLVARRKERKLVVILDGVDEAGVGGGVCKGEVTIDAHERVRARVMFQQ